MIEKPPSYKLKRLHGISQKMLTNEAFVNHIYWHPEIILKQLKVIMSIKKHYLYQDGLEKERNLVVGYEEDTSYMLQR